MVHMFPEKPKVSKGKITLSPIKKISGKARILLRLLVHKHWSNTENLDFLAKVILHRMGITLSDINWCCTNFSKTFDVRYKLGENNPIEFSIHQSYNQNNDLYYRAYFGVFARSLRIMVEWVTDDEEFFNSFMEDTDLGLDIKWDNKKNVGMRRVQGKMMIYLITSPGQLNFFRWAMQNKVVDYCIQNKQAIQKHAEETDEKNSNSGGKRKRLTESSSGFKVFKGPTLVEYGSRDRGITIRTADLGLEKLWV